MLLCLFVQQEEVCKISSQNIAIFIDYTSNNNIVIFDTITTFKNKT